MKIVLYGHGDRLAELTQLVNESITRLKFGELTSVSTTNDEAYAQALGITQNPALCVEEESIDFKDMIFEGIIPDHSELDAMFQSILGTPENMSSGGGCGTCSTGGCDTCGSSEEKDHDHTQNEEGSCCAH